MDIKGNTGKRVRLSISLDDIPNEVLIEIFVYQNVKDLLLNLVLVCKKWKTLCNHRILYEKKFRSKFLDQSNRFTDLAWICFRDLQVLLLRNDELGTYVSLSGKLSISYLFLEKWITMEEYGTPDEYNTWGQDNRLYFLRRNNSTLFIITRKNEIKRLRFGDWTDDCYSLFGPCELGTYYLGQRVYDEGRHEGRLEVKSERGGEIFLKDCDESEQKFEREELETLNEVENRLAEALGFENYNDGNGEEEDEPSEFMGFLEGFIGHIQEKTLDDLVLIREEGCADLFKFG